jgi:hypothetical protein
MKRPLLSLLFILLASWAVVCQARHKPVGKRPGPVKSVGCPENRDKLYARRDTLQQFANILNVSIPEFEKERGVKFHVENEKAMGFGVYDLTDPSNADPAETGACVQFIDNHIYHVVPVLNVYSFSHIIILEGGNFKVFRSVNCRDRGDKFEDVVAYLKVKLADDKNKDEVIGRVMNYRRYGIYARMDNFSRLRCEPEP